MQIVDPLPNLNRGVAQVRVRCKPEVGRIESTLPDQAFNSGGNDVAIEICVTYKVVSQGDRASERNFPL